jgi:hypothetical protein
MLRDGHLHRGRTEAKMSTKAVRKGGKQAEIRTMDPNCSGGRGRRIMV